MPKWIKPEMIVNLCVLLVAVAVWGSTTRAEVKAVDARVTAAAATAAAADKAIVETFMADVAGIKSDIDGLTPAVVELRVQVGKLTTAIELLHGGDE